MSGADFLMGNVGLKKNKARGAVDVSPEQISAVIEQMTEAAQNAANLGDGVAAVARAAIALVADSGLKLEGIAVLVQHKLGKGPGGKPKYSLQVVTDIIHGLVGLEDFLQRPSKLVKR